MYAAHARLRLGPVQLDYDLGFERRFRVTAWRREGAIWDTRFVPPAASASERVVVFFVVDGTLRWHEPEGFAVTGPSAFVTSAARLVGEHGRRTRTYRTGERLRAMELHFAPHDVLQPVDQPRPLSVSAATHAAAAEYVTLVDGDRKLCAAEREPVLAAVLRGLHRDRILAEDLSRTLRAPDGIDGRLWDACVPLVERMVLGPSLDQVSATTRLSVRQLGRALDRGLRRFSIPFGGWRDLSRGYRLNVAVMLLSNPALSVPDIAERCGYSSPEALSHALTAEGLPPPAELRRRILADAA